MQYFAGLREARTCKTSGERTVMGHANVNDRWATRDCETFRERTAVGHGKMNAMRKQETCHEPH